MKSKVLLSWMALGCAAMLSSGCYTVLKAPFASDNLREEPRLKAQDREWQKADQPRIGRFARDDEDRGMESGYGYGYPGFGMGYDSQYGAYGIGMPYGYGYSPYGYGYGYNPYSYGYGPYGYGYDPYYQGAGGVYIPPGYQLVTTQELAELRANSRGLADEPVPQSGPSPEELKQAEAKKQRDVWKLRTDPQSRPAPVVPSRPVAAPAGGDKEGDNAPKSATPPAQPSGAPPKKTRR